MAHKDIQTCPHCGTEVNNKGEHVPLYYCSICGTFFCVDPIAKDGYDFHVLLRDIYILVGNNKELLLKSNNIPIIYGFSNRKYHKAIVAFKKICDDTAASELLIKMKAVPEDDKRDEFFNGIAQKLEEKVPIHLAEAFFLVQSAAYAFGLTEEVYEYGLAEDALQAEKDFKESANLELSSNYSAVLPGRTVTLQWEFSIKGNNRNFRKKNKAKISPVEGMMVLTIVDVVTNKTGKTVVKEKGSMVYSPLHTTDFILTYTSKNGNKFIKKIQVEVQEPLKILDFKVSRSETLAGEPVKLMWNVRNHIMVTITTQEGFAAPVIRRITNTSEREYILYPKNDVVVTFTAEDRFGSRETRSKDISVKRPPQVSSTVIPKIPKVDFKMSLPKIPSVLGSGEKKSDTPILDLIKKTADMVNDAKEELSTKIEEGQEMAADLYKKSAEAVNDAKEKLGSYVNEEKVEEFKETTKKLWGSLKKMKDTIAWPKK